MQIAKVATTKAGRPLQRKKKHDRAAIHMPSSTRRARPPRFSPPPPLRMRTLRCVARRSPRPPAPVDGLVGWSVDRGRRRRRPTRQPLGAAGWWMWIYWRLWAGRRGRGSRTRARAAFFLRRRNNAGSAFARGIPLRGDACMH